MEICRIDLTEEKFEKLKNKTVACIGFFDGVHKMHKRILKKTKQIANKKSLDSIVITFDKKISLYLQNQENYFQSKEIKYEIFHKIMDPDFIFEIKVDQNSIKKSKEEFVHYLKRILNVEYIVVGSDFRFGFKAEGDVKYLRKNFNSFKIFKRKKNISTTNLKKAANKNEIKIINRILK